MRHSQQAALQPAEPRVETSPAQEMEERRLRLLGAEASSPSGGSEQASGSSIWEPVPASCTRVPTTSDVLNRQHSCNVLPADVVDAFIATILRPLAPGEGHESGNQAKERELCAVLDRLDPAQSLHLVRRLDADKPDDRLCQTFRRLLRERRERLKAFLRGAQRRHVVRG